MDQPEVPVHVDSLSSAGSLVDRGGASLGGAASLASEAPTDMGGLLDCLAARHGSPFRDALYRRDGPLRSLIQVCLDDRDIDELEGFRTPVAAGRDPPGWEARPSVGAPETPSRASHPTGRP